MKSKETVFAFDCGVASLGEAVRQGLDFPQVESWLIPDTFAETKTAAMRRRMMTTRDAHKEREMWLLNTFRDLGIEVLRGKEVSKTSAGWAVTRKADPRLTREFPKPGDDTCYTSCLLRIKLLRGEKLAPWQIYKAIRSATQKRGYDPDIPWKNREEKNQKKEEEETAAILFDEKLLRKTVGDNPDWLYPCYLDAFRMGLWNPARPNQLETRINHKAQSTRKTVMLRALVEKELRDLLRQAALQLPALAGREEFILYGPDGKYSSSSVRAGALSQKVPRFDNRIIDKCALIPRLNVCKIRMEGNHPHPASQIIFEITFLQKLKNMRVQGASDIRGLTPAEIALAAFSQKNALTPKVWASFCEDRGLHPAPAYKKLAFKDVSPVLPPETFRTALIEKLNAVSILDSNKRIRNLTEEEHAALLALFQKPRDSFSFSATQWSNFCEDLGVSPLPGHEEVKPPKAAGRARFCRPAAQILKRLILSGQAPAAFHAAEIHNLNGNVDPRKGLVASDLDFLLNMGDSWDAIRIPDGKLDAIANQCSSADEAIRKLIGSQNNPVVRHRLGVFSQRLRQLERRFGAPDHVVLEFVREDFMGEKARMELRNFQNRRAKARAEARERVAELGISEKNSLRYELFKAQGGRCLYTDDPLAETELDNYRVDHIVPRAKGGPDSRLNYALTLNQTNDDKGDRTPYEWLSGNPVRWQAYLNRVEARLKTTDGISRKTAQLLTLPNAVELAEKYTALAETAWISRLAQKIADLTFGWQNGVDAAGRKRTIIVSGGLTARIRRKYGLNRLLNPDASSEEEAEKKNRSDKRHHALDAMTISFIPQWARDPDKTGFFRFPKEIRDNSLPFFKARIDAVVPRQLCYEKAPLAETIYGLRKTPKENQIVKRTDLRDLAYQTVNMKTVYNIDYAVKTSIPKIMDDRIKSALLEFAQSKPPEEDWNRFVAQFAPFGSLVRRVRLVETALPPDSMGEFKNMSKDGTPMLRKPLKANKGQYVFVEPDGKIKVRPVYSFESPFQVQAHLLADNAGRTIQGFYQTGCLVELAKDTEAGKHKIPKGVYRLSTIRADAYVGIFNTSGNLLGPIGIQHLLPSGFKRIDG